MIEQNSIVISTNGCSLTNITHKIQRMLIKQNITAGLCNLFIQHTSASLIITENADPSVLRDVENFTQKWILDGDPAYLHNYEGDDDMAAHLRTLFTQNSLTVPIHNGTLALGTWQGIFLWEHRYHEFSRSILVTFYF